MASSGNFSTLNPLDNTENNGVGGCDFAIGNCQGGGAGDNVGIASTIATGNTGKYYAEFYLSATPGTAYVGYYPSNESAIMVKLWTPSGNRTWLNSNLASYAQNGYLYKDGSSSSSWGATFTTTDIIQIAIDADNDAVYYGKNNTWQNSGNPESGASKTGAARTSIPKNIFPAVGHANGSGTVTWKANFGQDSTFGGTISAGGNADANGFGDFKYAPPSGYVALSTANLPISDDIDPAQTDDDYPGKQFNAVLYTGNGGAQNVTGFGFKPDLVWVKRRNAVQSHRLADSTRGAKTLYPDSDIDEDDMAISYTADGFDWGTGTGAANNANASGGTYVAWGWKANASTTASNTTGGTNSVTQANTKTGFSIITYTGFAGSSGSSTVGHGMSVAPEFIIHKSRTRSSGWWCQHTGLTNAGYFIDLSGTGGQSDLSSYGTMNAPSTSVFTINGVDGIGGESANYVAYAWANLDGMQKFGKYEGNGNADGPFIYTGFRPRFVFVKNIDASQHWVSHDSARETFNPMDTPIDLDEAYAEYTSSNRAIDFLSNGFKCRTSDGEINSAQTFIYGAWADVPFKYNNTF